MTPPAASLGRICLAALLLGAFGGRPAAAQEQKGKETRNEKTDETNEAADLLRRLLKLKPGSGADTAQEPKPEKEQKQDPEPPPKTVPPVQPEKIDETEKGAEAIKKLLPGAKPVVVPPVVEPAPPPHPVEQDPDRREPALDPLEIARRALRRRLPEAPLVRKPAEVAPETWPVHGSLSLSGRRRWSSEDRDTDLRAVLALDFGDPQRDRVTGHFLGRGNLDADGRRRVGAFRGIDETFGGDVAGRLYEAYVDVHRVAPLAVARIGRQTIIETPIEAWFDGARLKTVDFGELGWWVEAWGGAPSRLYQSAAGAWLYGAAVGAAPRPGSRLRLDWMHAADDTANGRLQNDLVGVAVDQAVGDASRVHAAYTWLEGDSRDYTLRGTTSIDDWGVTAQLTYYELLSTQRAFVTEFDPYFTSAFEYFPYRQLGATISKQFSELLTTTAGADLRRLADRRDEGQFNRDYERFYLSSTVYPLLDQSLSLTVSGDYWNSPGDDIASLGVDLAARPFRAFSTALGSAFALYRFDSFTGRERDHVRTYYLRFDYRAGSAARLDLRYEFEDDDIGRFHELRAGITWRF